MKIIASLTGTANASPTDYGSYQSAEATRVWDLYTNGVLKEIYLRTETIGAVIVLECASHADAEEAIQSLPMVKAGLFNVDYLSLGPTPPMSKMLKEHNQPLPSWWPK